MEAETGQSFTPREPTFQGGEEDGLFVSSFHDYSKKKTENCQAGFRGSNKRVATAQGRWPLL